jgi:hypothetical protein
VFVTQVAEECDRELAHPLASLAVGGLGFRERALVLARIESGNDLRSPRLAQLEKEPLGRRRAGQPSRNCPTAADDWAPTSSLTTCPFLSAFTAAGSHLSSRPSCWHCSLAPSRERRRVRLADVDRSGRSAADGALH